MYNDNQRTQMRSLLNDLETRISQLPLALADEAAGLRSDWAKLADLLALGPEPELRTCPTCGSRGMRAATVCGVCWTKLIPAA